MSNCKCIKTTPLAVLRDEVKRRMTNHQRIIKLVAKHHGVTLADMIEPRSYHTLTRPRCMAASIMRERGTETARIADLFGTKPDTVRKWLKKHSELMSDELYKNIYKTIR